MAVVLDVVYNHLGPEGNYLWDYGPYFIDKYKSPWGDAINFDGPYSDDVRHYFIESALHWITDYHIDALRIDAIHGIFDFSAKPFLQELGEEVHHRSEGLGRRVYVIPESDLNDVRVINPAELGGYGLDAQWNDDFHHALHTLLTGEQSGYYRDFGTIEHLEKAFREGFVYSGEYSAFRKRRHGSSSKDRPARQFVVFSQNHDQVGNRMLGDRLGRTQSLEQLKLAAAVVFLSPFIPLLFMGEEYGETAPFQYFVSHSEEALVEAVRRGRREEFASFGWKGTVPDPQDEQTFLRSRLQLGLREAGRHKTLVEFYRKLIALRREAPALSHLSKKHLEVKGLEDARTLFVRRWNKEAESEVCCFFTFNTGDFTIAPSLPKGWWKKALDSADSAWSGPGTLLPEMIRQGDELVFRGTSAVVYERSMV
jgi:maltooligosyltrehalose trehalohydrolase